MFNKRRFIISLFSFIVILGLSQGQSAEAQGPLTQPYAFTPLIYEPLDISLEGACLATENATQQWLFELPVSTELLTELENSAADGRVASIQIGTLTDIRVDGTGSAQVDEVYELAIFDDSSGRETIQARAFRSVTKPYHDGLRLMLKMEDVIVSSLDAGDVLLVKAQISGVLRAEGCDQYGQAPLLSMRKYIDASSPYLSFSQS